MANIVTTKMLIYTEAMNNNNKFYEAKLFDDGSCRFRWGRVEDGDDGTCGQTKTFPGLGSHGFEAKLAEKRKKGYREMSVVGEVGAGKAEEISKEQLKEVVKNELAGQDPILKALVEQLAEANRHQLMAATGGSLNLDLSTGIVTTALGVVVSQDSIDQARKLLNQMPKFVQKQDFDNAQFVNAINEYLMLVPQKVGRERGWHRDFFAHQSALVQQNTLLDQLSASVDLVEQRVEAAKKAKIDGASAKKENVFNVKLRLVSDKKIIKEIEKFFHEGVNTAHVSRHLRPVQIYEVEIDHMAQAFKEDGENVGNIQRLWHGTRAFNVLSILKSGLIIPKNVGTFQITGRMFGDGLYFSDQATKSLNYSYGYWDGGSRDNECFMFLADVAMGKEHTPSGPSSSLPVKGSDSTFAKAGKSGVQNNEMIVYRTGQANLRYLVKFQG